MPTNLVSLVMQFLTPDMIGKIASTFGLDRSATGRAITAAVPALLGGFMKSTETSEGANRLYDAVSRQPPGFLDGLSSMLGTPSQAATSESGTAMLSSLLGGSTTQSLAGAIARFARIDPNSASPLMGLLGSVVTGALAKETSSSRLDASGLSDLLAAQKGNIQAALPSGFSDILRSSRLLSDVTGVTGEAQRAASTAAEAARYSAQRAALTQQARWQYWAIPAAIVLAALWWLYGSRMTPNVTEQAQTTQPQQVERPATTGALPSAEQMKARTDQAMAALRNIAGGTEIANQATSALDAVKTSLSGITDTATAQAALPRLIEEQAQMDRIRNLVGALPADGRSALATIAAANMPALNEQIARVLAIPGVAEILKGPMDGLRANLATLTKSPA
ncbi:DUF937 domain-containing protein [Microvirga terricola]|uniref:DUF937 domain-containing protein n=1 Tax=Microvirga terricola TaxID=2719797 RepID=A0ABX0VAV2_9HYPH|nr:DUF937 domain-containing protein [Microvirga terricola]NIX76982.1 DUF937 domain-containing protein [Microvirga terricola]